MSKFYQSSRVGREKFPGDVLAANIYGAHLRSCPTTKIGKSFQVITRITTAYARVFDKVIFQE